MKKIKLMVLILSAFFAFGIQSASAQTYVDAQTARLKISDKIKDLSNTMDNIRQNSGVGQTYYDAKTRFDYYNALAIALKRQNTVEDALDKTPVLLALSAAAADQADMVSANPNDRIVKSAIVDEAKALLQL